MRNCLPKIASVFRSKASSTAAHSNESDAESDTEERYIKVKSTTMATPAAAAITKVESDQLIDNANKKPQQQQLQSLRPPAKATSRAAASAAADDVDKNRLIRESSGSVVKAKDLDLEKQQRQSQRSGGQQNSIRKEMKQAEPRGTGRAAGEGGEADTAEDAVASRAEIASLARPFAHKNNNGGGGGGGGTTSKTPEQIELEYEANVAAERGDIMTPLPRDPRPQGLAFNETPSGRQMQPEIVEAIRNLDTQELLLNNLTLEDRCRLTQSSSSSRLDDDAGGEGTVMLRAKANPFDRQCHSLYERRLHKGPKLHLWVGNGKPRPTPQSDDDDIKTFQVVKAREGRVREGKGKGGQSVGELRGQAAIGDFYL